MPNNESFFQDLKKNYEDKMQTLPSHCTIIPNIDLNGYRMRAIYFPILNKEKEDSTWCLSAHLFHQKW